jgi:hypothetical protein
LIAEEIGVEAELELSNEQLRQQALEQIKNITQTIEADNKIQFPAIRFIAYGIGILIIPAIEYGTNLLTFGFDWGDSQFQYLAASHVIFYFLYFQAIRLILRAGGLDINELDGAHLLIRKALSLHLPVVVAIAGLVILLPVIGQVHLAYPIVYILFGILLNIYGHFVSRMVMRVSWYLIAAGLIYVYVSKYQNTEVWIIFNSFLGLAFIYLGVRHKNARA